MSLLSAFNADMSSGWDNEPSDEGNVVTAFSKEKTDDAKKSNATLKTRCSRANVLQAGNEEFTLEKDLFGEIGVHFEKQLVLQEDFAFPLFDVDGEGLGKLRT